MNINQYLDATYLKLPEQAGISEAETDQIVKDLIQQCIDENFKLAMIRPNFVALGRQMVDAANSDVLIGTVIGFHEGTYPTADKLAEAEQAVKDGVDELDYVVNYEKGVASSMMEDDSTESIVSDSFTT